MLFRSANSNWAVQNALYDLTNTVYASSNSNWVVQNLVYATVNAAYTLANAAYSNANSLAIAANSYAGYMANSANIYTEATYVKLTWPSQTITGDLGLTGNLTISGDVTYVNTTQLQVGDNIITLNADLPMTVAPLQSAGIEVNRGNLLSNSALLWQESASRWAITDNVQNVITTYIASNTDLGSAFDVINASYASANSNWVVQNAVYDLAKIGRAHV